MSLIVLISLLKGIANAPQRIYGVTKVTPLTNEMETFNPYVFVDNCSRRRVQHGDVVPCLRVIIA